MSNVSISGAISGIDTASLVNQLMTVEGQSQTNIKTKQTAAQKAADTYTSLITSLKSLATQSAALAKTSSWQGSTATSSSSSVTAKSAGNATGTLTFDVTAVAAAHTLVSEGSVATTGSSVASSGKITVSRAGSADKELNVGNGTLAEVVAAVNGSDLGLRAAAVQTAPGQYRLQVTSATSGAASAFTLGGVDGFTSMKTLTAGADAQLTIGADPLTQYTVSSATNTFADLVPGLSFTVSKKETGVTVDSKLDGTAIADQVKAMVDATNTALDTLKSTTAYDFTKKTGAALYGDNSIKSLQQQILSSVSSSNAPGVQLSRDGKLTFDSAAFIKAFQADPAKTASAFGATSSFTPNTGVLGKAAMVLSNDTTRAGTYAIDVTVAAAKEQWSLASDPAVGQAVSLTQGSLSASYTLEAGKTLAYSVAQINSKAAAAGIGVTASISSSGTSIDFTANSAGTAGAFSVKLDAAAGTKTTSGVDVVGTIDGEAATGVGNILTLSSKTSGANGLGVSVDVTTADITASAGAIGDLTFKPGLAQKLSTLLNDVTDSTTGALGRAQQGRVDDVKDFQAQIDAWDIRLAARRATLTRQFTAMETALASLKSSSSAITNLLATSSTSSS